MKHWAAVLAIAAPLCASRRTRPNWSAKQPHGWTQGAVKQDTAALKRFLADDLQYAHAGGQHQNKEQYIAGRHHRPGAI